MGRRYDSFFNKVSSVDVVNGKVLVTLNTWPNAYNDNFNLATYTPGGSPGPGPGPTPTPVTTYKLMQNGVDITNNVKSAIGTGSALSIKTSSSGGGNTQWETSNEINILASGYYLSDGCYKDGIFYVVTTDYNTNYKVYASVDNGATFTLKSTITCPDNWSINNTLHIEATTNRLLMFSFSDYTSNTPTSTCLVSTDNGVTWTTAFLPSTRYWSCVCQYNGVLILSDIDIEDNGTIYRSDNEGLTWSSVSEHYLYDAAHSQGKFIGLIWAAGGSGMPGCTQITTSSDSGATWSSATNISTITSGLPSGTYIWTQMTSDEQYVYIVGHRTDVSNNLFYVIRSADGGISFTPFMTINKEYESGSYANYMNITTFNGEFIYSQIGDLQPF